MIIGLLNVLLFLGIITEIPTSR